MTTDICPLLESVFREVFEDDLPADIGALDRDSLEAWDSLGHIRVVTALEEAFAVSFTIDEIDAMTSVPKIIETLHARQ
jgi:acyl carrier protein